MTGAQTQSTTTSGREARRLKKLEQRTKDLKKKNKLLREERDDAILPSIFDTRSSQRLQQLLEEKERNLRRLGITAEEYDKATDLNELVRTSKERRRRTINSSDDDDIKTTPASTAVRPPFQPEAAVATTTAPSLTQVIWAGQRKLSHVPPNCSSTPCITRKYRSTKICLCHQS